MSCIVTICSSGCGFVAAAAAAAACNSLFHGRVSHVTGSPPAGTGILTITKQQI